MLNNANKTLCVFGGSSNKGGFVISCSGATNSVSFAVVVDQYGFDNIETQEIQNALQIILDGAVLDSYVEPLAVGLKLEVSVETDVPFQIENGFVVKSVLKYSNISELPKRLEIKSATKHVKFYMWANPTVNQIDGNTRNHVGACLSAKTESQFEINCDGATNGAWFTNGSGAFHITVNDQLFENTGSWGVGYMINQIPELAAILEGEGDGDFRFFNKISNFLRIKLEPIEGDTWGIKGENNNPTIGISDDGVIQFCLAPPI